MGPEIPNSAAESGGDSGFLAMAASMPPFDANQIGQTTMGPPMTPSAEQAATAPPAEHPTEVEQISEQIVEAITPPQPAETAMTSTPETSAPADSTPATANSTTSETAAKPAPENTSETNSGKAPEAATSSEKSDFPPELLADIAKYTDTLKAGAQKDLEMAKLLQQLVDVASHQHTTIPNGHTETKPTDTPDTPGAVNSPNQPAASEAPSAPADAIAAALAEATNSPVPGPAVITTPANSSPAA